MSDDDDPAWTQAADVDEPSEKVFNEATFRDGISAVDNIVRLFDTIAVWTHTQASTAHSQLAICIIEADRAGVSVDAKEAKTVVLKTLCERSLAFLQAVVSQFGPLAVVPMFPFIEEVVSTVWGVKGDSTGGMAKQNLRNEFIRVISLIRLDSKFQTSNFIDCVAMACFYPSLRDILSQRSNSILSIRAIFWREYLAQSNFCVVTNMIRVLSCCKKSDLIAKLCKSGGGNDSNLLKLFKDRNFSPLLYHDLVLACIERIKPAITHHGWFTNVLTSFIDVASVSVANTQVSRKEVLQTLLSAVSNREYLDLVGKNAADIPATFVETFLIKMVCSKNDSDASEFSWFLVLFCEHSCQSVDANVENPLLHMFIRPLCDLECTRRKSGFSGNSSGYEKLVYFHYQVLEKSSLYFHQLKQMLSPDQVDNFASKILEVWESAVWNALGTKAKSTAKAAVGAAGGAHALSNIQRLHISDEQAVFATASSVVADLDTRIQAASSSDEHCIARLAKFSQLKNDSSIQAEEFEKQAAALLQIKETRMQELDDIHFQRLGILEKHCQTQLWSEECSRLEQQQRHSTAEIAAITDEISELRKQLEEREQRLQSTIRQRDSVGAALSKFEESRTMTQRDLVEEEETSAKHVSNCIDSAFDRSVSAIFDASADYSRLKKRLEDVEREAREEYAAWQCDVCAKAAEQISRGDMAMLFCAAGLAEEHQRAVLEQDLDGATFVNLSLHTLADELGTRSVNHRLLLQHVAESIKNGNLASLFTPSGPNNPLSWNLEQVLQWLQREDLGVLSEAVARERITGLALMQLNDETIKSLLNVKIPLRTLANINSKLQALQASTIGIIQASFSSVRPDIRNSVVAGLAGAIDGGDPVDVPMALLCEWTENFSASLAIGSGSFGEVFRACFSNSDRSSCGLVAVKRINPALNLSSREQQRSDAITALKREISVLRAFRHPGIIRLLGYSLPAEGLSARSLPSVTNACLVYELGMRGTLHALLSNPVTAVQLTWERRLRLALDVAHALNYMHSREPGNPAFHRDVKSSNIVVNESWHAKLIDCGLAKYIPSQEVPGLASLACETNAGQRFGTLAYMCPEYFMCYSLYDQKSEVFSFGTVLGELLTGKLQQPPVVIMNRMLRDAEQMPADAHAGDWPPACVAALRGLALQCMADKAQRTASMLLVVKQLSPLVSEYCPQTALEVSVQIELLSLYRKQQHQVVADAMKQREATALAKERSQRQQRTCCVCGDDDKDATSVIQCQNRECGMHFCLECFQRDIRVQCGHEERSQFVRNHRSIVCCMCRQHEFADRNVLAFVDDATFAILRQACNDVVELQAYNKAKSEFQSKVEEMRSELIRVQGATEQRIYRHRLHICEHILTLKCPRRDCGNAVLDFDGCFAVSCSCGCGFCGWCLADCGRDAHPHVLQCPSSANPGTYYGTVEQFERTQRERRKIAVQQYLASLPQEDAAKVRAAIARDVADVGFSV